MPRISTVRNPRQVGFRYTPRKRRSLAGRLFESLIVGIVITLMVVGWLVLWAVIVALPWALLALVLHLLGAF